MIVIACRTPGCPNPVRIPDGHPLAEQGHLCFSCDHQARENIALNLLRHTGSPRGGMALVEGRLIARQDENGVVSGRR